MQYGPLSDGSKANGGPLSFWRSMLERYRALSPMPTTTSMPLAAQAGDQTPKHMGTASGISPSCQVPGRLTFWRSML